MFVCVSAGSNAFGQKIGGLGLTKRPKIDWSDRVVSFMAMDDVTIEADFYPVKVKGRKTTPIAILIHMYPADRSSWKPLVPALREAGIAVLAYDIRGTGGSTKAKGRNLEEGYKSGDAGHFRPAWMDVQGAVQWLDAQRHIDVRRMVLIGASVGCSISFDFHGRTAAAKGIVCLSPGTNYLGLNSIEHIQRCSKTPILLMSPESEYQSVESLLAVGGELVVGKQYPGDKSQHGTGMLEADHGEKVSKTILSFVKKNLGIKEKKKNKDKDKKKKRKKRSKK